MIWLDFFLRKALSIHSRNAGNEREKREWKSRGVQPRGLFVCQGGLLTEIFIRGAGLVVSSSLYIWSG